VKSEVLMLRVKVQPAGWWIADRERERALYFVGVLLSHPPATLWLLPFQTSYQTTHGQGRREGMQVNKQGKNESELIRPIHLYFRSLEISAAQMSWRPLFSPSAFHFPVLKSPSTNPQGRQKDARRRHSAATSLRPSRPSRIFRRQRKAVQNPGSKLGIAW
jgi:hypothetical protein